MNLKSEKNKPIKNSRNDSRNKNVALNSTTNSIFSGSNSSP